MTDISGPSGLNKPLNYNTFERIAKDASVSDKSTIHLGIGPGGREIIGLEAKNPIAGRLIRALGKPIGNLKNASDAHRNGILATQAFKQALVQRYGETIANAVDKHLLQSGRANILTAADLRKNLKVADAIVRILKQTPQPAKRNHELSNSSNRRNEDGSPLEPSPAKESSAARNHELSYSSSRRNDDGSPAEPSAPPRSRSSSIRSESSVDAYFRHREQPPAYRSTEDLRPSAPPLPNPKEVSEIDEAGNQWHHNPLFVNTDEALEIAGESASLPEDPEAAKAAQRPRTKALSEDELEASFKAFEDLLNDPVNKSSKS